LIYEIVCHTFISPSRSAAVPELWTLGGFGFMHASITNDIVQIVGFAILICAPFSKRRVRARWANMVFILGSTIGIAKGSITLAWDLGWFTVSDRSGRLLEDYLSMTGGLLLGFLFSLIFSGQLTGKKQPPNKSLQATAAAPASCD
jgi:hypothetical protein